MDGPKIIMQNQKNLKKNKLICLRLTVPENIDYSSYTLINHKKVKIRFSYMFKIPRPWSELKIYNKKDEQHSIVFQASEVYSNDVDDFLKQIKKKNQFIKTDIIYE